MRLPAGAHGVGDGEDAAMKRYLSYGGGVNSTALGLWLIDHGIEAEWVYADHGADWPETREYVAMLQAKGYPVTVLETRRNGVPIYEFCWECYCIPMRMARWCTDHWKVRPLHAYMQPPCTVYLGISYEERHRADKLAGYVRNGEIKEFPLVDERINRASCVEIIEAHGLPVPIKSGCYFCPHQRAGQVRLLRTMHKDLFEKALKLERRANYAQMVRWIWRAVLMGSIGMVTKALETYYLVADKPLDVVAMDNQPDLFGERDMSPCLCEL